MKERSVDPKMAANFLKRHHPQCVQYLKNESVLKHLSVVLYEGDRRGYSPDIIDTSQSAGRMLMKTEDENAPCITRWPWIDAALAICSTLFVLPLLGVAACHGLEC